MGAGASYGYNGSRTGVNPPLATTYFRTFQRLLISQDIEVKIGNIINYVRDTRHIDVLEMAESFDENIERLFAELHGALNAEIELVERGRSISGGPLNMFSLSRAYDQFIFWFAHVLNEVQNGSPCEIYARLIQRVGPEDIFLTFNWDTIFDRTLAETGKWYPDDGYHVKFHQLYDRAWRDPRSTQSAWKLLKLHGSTNWLGPYVTLRFDKGTRGWISSAERVNFTWCIVDASARYSSYKDRWRPDYGPFSYFFPPDDPVLETPLMPIIIPPTASKNFSEYGNILGPIWQEAASVLKDARKLVIIGYSFPETDEHAFSLLESFMESEGSGKLIEIIDPFPEGVSARVSKFIDSRCALEVHSVTLAEFLGFPKAAANTHSEYENFKMPPKAAEPDAANPRLALMLYTLEFCNLHGQPVDITTFRGKRYLDCEIVGEFATHLLCAYRDEVYKYRVENIRIKPKNGDETLVNLYDIWLLNPMPAKGFTEDDLKKVDLSEADRFDPLLGCNLRESIRKGYHCENDAEVDYFLRRYIAS